MPSPYLQRPVRTLPQAMEEIARERGIPVAELYRQSGGVAPQAKAESADAALAAKAFQDS
jgi:hypothetical protein